jgi:hypothetical protein
MAGDFVGGRPSVFLAPRLMARTHGGAEFRVGRIGVNGVGGDEVVDDGGPVFEGAAQLAATGVAGGGDVFKADPRICAVQRLLRTTLATRKVWCNDPCGVSCGFVFRPNRADVDAPM